MGVRHEWHDLKRKSTRSLQLLAMTQGLRVCHSVLISTTAYDLQSGTINGIIVGTVGATKTTAGLLLTSR